MTNDEMYEKLAGSKATSLRLATEAICDACEIVTKKCVDEHLTEEAAQDVKKKLCEQKGVLDQVFLAAHAKTFSDLMQTHDGEADVTLHDLAHTGTMVGTLNSGESMGISMYRIVTVEGETVLFLPSSVCDLAEDENGKLHILAKKFMLDPLDILASLLV